jgi:hypothetical protein
VGKAARCPALRRHVPILSCAQRVCRNSPPLSRGYSQRVFAACRSHGVLARARRAMIEDSLGLGTNGFGPNPISPSAPVVTGSYARSTRRKDVPSKKLHKNSGLIH